MKSFFRALRPKLLRAVFLLVAAAAARPHLVVGEEPDVRSALAQSLFSEPTNASGRLGRSGLIQSSSTPLVVPIHTRQVSGDGSQATNFSLQVGTNLYIAPPLPEGGNSGYHLVQLSRRSLQLVSNNSYSTSADGIGHLLLALQTLTGDNLVVLSSMKPTPLQTETLAGLYAVLLTVPLGWNLIDLFDPFANQTASNYSLIGSVGLNPNEGFEVSNLANPLLTQGIDAVLTLDVNANYFPVQPSFVTLQTSGGPTQSAVTVATRTSTTNITAPPLPAGSAGGIHLVVLRRDILDQVSTNPAVVVANASFPTGGPDLQAGSQALIELGVTIASYEQQTPLGGGQVLVVLASMGTPFVNCSTTPCPAPWGLIYQANLEALSIRLQVAFYGAVGDLGNAGTGSYYSLIGVPTGQNKEGAATLEDRSWTPLGAGSTNLTVGLQRTPKGWFSPVASDFLGGIDYRLYQIAYQPSVAWLVAPNASSAPCAAGDEQCAAYQWISQKVAGVPSIRDQYLNDNSPIDTYQDAINGTVYPSSESDRFSETVFRTVRNHLGTEAGYAASVRSLYVNYNQLILSFTAADTGNLLNALSTVQNNVTVATNSSVAYDVDSVLKFVIEVGTAVDPDPDSKAALGVVNALLGFGFGKNRTSSGNSNNGLYTAEEELWASLVGTFQGSQSGSDTLFSEILTDWGKLSAIGPLVNENVAGNGFYWTLNTPSQVLGHLTSPFTLSFYQSLMPVAYQMVFFDSVTFTNPSAYCYQNECGGGFCRCHSDVYTPPDFDFFLTGTGSGNLIYVLATPAKAYPASGLVQTQLPGLGVYMPDFWQGRGRWTGIMPVVQPEGWSNYLNPVGGWCDGTLLTNPQPDGTVRLITRGTLGRHYQLERTTDLRKGWLPHGDVVQGGADLLQLSMPIFDSEAVFFRLRPID